MATKTKQTPPTVQELFYALYGLAMAAQHYNLQDRLNDCANTVTGDGAFDYAALMIERCPPEYAEPLGD
jgi:hypothetical protein